MGECCLVARYWVRVRVRLRVWVRVRAALWERGHNDSRMVLISSTFIAMSITAR